MLRDAAKFCSYLFASRARFGPDAGLALQRLGKMHAVAYEDRNHCAFRRTAAPHTGMSEVAGAPRMPQVGAHALEKESSGRPKLVFF